MEIVWSPTQLVVFIMSPPTTINLLSCYKPAWWNPKVRFMTPSWVKQPTAPAKWPLAQAAWPALCSSPTWAPRTRAAWSPAPPTTASSSSPRQPPWCWMWLVTKLTTLCFAEPSVQCDKEPYWQWTISVPPVRAKIVREWAHFTAGDIYNVTCQVRT